MDTNFENSQDMAESNFENSQDMAESKNENSQACTRCKCRRSADHFISNGKARKTCMKCRTRNHDKKEQQIFHMYGLEPIIEFDADQWPGMNFS